MYKVPESKDGLVDDKSNLQTVLHGAGPPPTLQLAQQSKLALYNHTTILFTTRKLKQIL